MINVLQKLCGLLTKHRNSRYVSTIPYYRGSYNEFLGAIPEFYCKCRLCGYRYWTEIPPKEAKEPRTTK